MMMKRKLSGLLAAILLCAALSFAVCAADTTVLGEKTTVGDIVYYTNEDGWASAPIAGTGITWVRAGYEGIETWYGIGDVTGALPEDAVFRVRIISERDLTDGYYGTVRDSLRRVTSDGDDRYLDIQITDADGMIYTGSMTADYYIELGDEYDAQDVIALFEGDPVTVTVQRITLEGESITFAKASCDLRNVKTSPVNTETGAVSDDKTADNAASGWKTAAIAETVVIIGLIAFIAADRLKKKKKK